MTWHNVERPIVKLNRDRDHEIKYAGDVAYPDLSLIKGFITADIKTDGNASKTFDQDPTVDV